MIIVLRYQHILSLTVPGDVSGELLVDIGSGPTLYQVLSGCEVFNKVLLTDFLEVNRKVLRGWLQDEGGGSLDWTPYLQHVCKLEGRRYDRIPLNSVGRLEINVEISITKNDDCI